MRILKIIFISFILLFSSYGYGQQNLDTLNVQVGRYSRKNGYTFGFCKMSIRLDNNQLLRDEILVHDSIILCLDHPKPEKLFLRIYKKDYLFAEGEWNESGFLKVVSYYNRKGDKILEREFDRGEYIGVIKQ